MEPDDAIQPDEILLRRVPKAQMNGGPPFLLSDNAFDPHRDRDRDGLSVYRKAFHTPQEVADMRTMGKCNVWVAEIPASAIMAMGLTIDPRPLAGTAERPAQPGHAVLRELNSQTRNSDRAQEWKHQLVLAVTGLTGPYAPPDGRVVAAAAPS